MFGERHEIGLILESMTPLHIGTGETVRLRKDAEDGNEIEAQGATKKSAEYDAVVRDHENRPYLPSTSIKGALRRLAEQAYPDSKGIDVLFGTIKRGRDDGKTSEADQGAMGLLLVRGGTMSGAAPDNFRAPFPAADRRGAFIAAATAIKGKTGVADDHKLFHQEMVVPGACFDVRMTLLSFGKKDNQQHALTLLKWLLALVARDGLTVGRAQADGQGQLKVKGEILMSRWVLGKDGDLENDERITIGREPNNVGSRHVDRRSFALACAAPFAIIDSSVKGAGKDMAKEQGTIQLSAQRLAADRPLVLGSSLSGALRARAHWLWGLQVLRAGKEPDDQIEGIRPEDELFGTTDRRACVEIRALTVDRAATERITSLKIDRFTGAPVHGALFTTEAFTGTRLSFDLILVKRGASPSAAARRLWNMLVDDISKNDDLMLGHGTNKGFGWFKRVT